MPRVFLSYRRDDTTGFAGRLCDSLENALGRKIVFRDVDDLTPGADFGEAIAQRLREVDAVLVMIGPRWLEAERDGLRRLDVSDDHVRREVETAFELGKTVIPVLVDGAQMPPEEALPEPLRPLARRHAIAVNDASWSADVERLATSLEPGLPVVAGPPVQQIPQSWLITGALVGLLFVIGAFLLTSRFWISPPEIAGTWEAQVDYDWGVSQVERFEFRFTGDDVTGSATFLGIRRAIENALLEGERLEFQTRSRELVGNEQRELVHRYDGTVGEGEIRFTMSTTGGFSEREPITFVARRPER